MISSGLTLPEVRTWLESSGFLRPDLWDDAGREKIAAKFGGEVLSTGGNCMVILIPRENGDVIAITEEVICLYKKREGDVDAYDVFWNSDEAESISLCD